MFTSFVTLQLISCSVMLLLVAIAVPGRVRSSSTLETTTVTITPDICRPINGTTKEECLAKIPTCADLGFNMKW